jgi:hypothetical protein
LNVDELHSNDVLSFDFISLINVREIRMVESRRRFGLLLNPMQSVFVLGKLGGQYLKATLRCRRVSSARYTSPTPPAPSWLLMP